MYMALSLMGRQSTPICLVAVDEALSVALVCEDVEH